MPFNFFYFIRMLIIIDKTNFIPYNNYNMYTVATRLKNVSFYR